MYKNAGNYLTYFHLTLEMNSTQRYMGTINHLQVAGLDAGDSHDGPTHSVRFWDGKSHRSLEGAVTVQEEGAELLLDMGHGKKYRFRKLGR